MSYIIEQTINGNIYLYKVEHKWDKVKKKDFQKRTYIGPKNPKNSTKTNKKGVNLVNKNFGNIYFLEFL